MIPFVQIMLQYNPYSSAYAGFYYGGGSVFTEELVTTLAAILSVLAFAMQVSRGYFLRVLRKFTLRLAADVWWLIFALLRDASIFLVLFLGVTLFWTGSYQDYVIGMPFSLLSVDFFAAALVLILYKDTNEDQKANALLTGLITVGMVLMVFSFVFITQSPLQLTGTNVPTVSSNTGNPWGFLYTYFNSINSPTIAIYSFYVCVVLLAIAGALATKWSFEQWAPYSRNKSATGTN